MFKSYSKVTKAKAKNDKEEEKPQTIFDAIRLGDMKAYQEFFKTAGIGKKTETGESLLTMACAYNQLEIARHLVANKHKVSEQDTETWFTPLHHAVKVDAREVVDLLLQQGADIEAKSKENYRPLHVAAQTDRFYLAVALLQKGAKVDAGDLKGFQPIHFASEGGFQAMVELFTGAYKEKEGEKKGKVVKVDYSKFPTVDINTKTDSDWTPLHFASGRGRTELVHYMCNHNADVNAKADDGTTPLYFAAEVGAVDVVKALLFHKADPNLCRRGGLSPLFCNAVVGRIPIIEMLLKGGADVDMETADGETALIVASGKGNLAVVRVLLAAEADPNMCMATTGQTALHKAIKNGHPEVVELLLTNGADFNSSTRHRETPLIVAVRDCQSNQAEILATLLSRKVQLDSRDKTGMTALHYAVQHGDMELVELLIKHGANLNLPNLDGRHPVHLCSARGHTEILPGLLSRCRDMNALDLVGNTCLHLAVAERQMEAARLILTHKPRITPNSSGETPLDLALAAGQEDIAEYIQQYMIMQVCNKNYYFAIVL